ncbi:ABC transporter ATP-binding protein [Nocardioides sp. BP30]|uniref:ABC transporter ATP-binding protein n=1 Tax=Nocardioides sp. BP30 TaxID=3036374 RepID=UPI002468866D|nr:ABC transporter ATP-binding protein [Nocardioides sp. BP30]WGL52448.1 ABC transporter ATP-binding protein [Nocardioides sp. BP30]
MGLRAVRVRGIRKDFGDVVALDGVDIDVEAGTVHGLVGPNGAGKTTLLGMLLGLAAPDAGDLEILGRPVGRDLAVPDGVAGFVDGPGLYPALTARKNLRTLATLRGYAASSVEDALEEVGLLDVADDPVRGFSLGMRQRLGLAAALLGDPRLLVLDEPANGLDPAGKRHVHRVIMRLAERGAAVVLSSHRMDDLAALCGDVTLLAAGRVVFSGPLAKLAAESGDLDYRLVTSDGARAREVAARTPGITVVSASVMSSEVLGAEAALVVRGSVPRMDELVTGIVGSGIAVRELGPVTPPLEAAFLALTGETSEERPR